MVQSALEGKTGRLGNVMLQELSKDLEKNLTTVPKHDEKPTEL